MNLTAKPELVNRGEMHYVYLQKVGSFAEIAPKTWHELFPLAKGHIEQQQVISCMGLGFVQVNAKGEKHDIYQAGFSLTHEPRIIPAGLQYKKIKGGTYARFVWTGPYDLLGEAWQKALQTVHQEKIKMRQDFCIENYLNDPATTAQEELQTELLVPVY